MDEVLLHALTDPFAPLSTAEGQEDEGLKAGAPTIQPAVNEEREDTPPLGTH
jgi:ATP-dependent Lon protease